MKLSGFFLLKTTFCIGHVLLAGIIELKKERQLTSKRIQLADLIILSSQGLLSKAILRRLSDYAIATDWIR